MIRKFWNKIRPSTPPPVCLPPLLGIVPQYPLDALETFDVLPQMAFPPDAMESLDSAILSKIRQLQYGLSFDETRFLIVTPPPAGFGASFLGSLSKGLMCGYLYDRTLLLDDSRLVYDCIYEPVSVHSLKEISQNRRGRKVICDDLLKIRDLHSHKIVYFLGMEETNFGVHPDLISLLPLPARGLYMRGLILESFLKLKAEYRAHIKEKKEAIGFKGPIIGVHLRFGDVANTTQAPDRHLPLSVYLKAVAQIVNITGINTVFVTTDSEEVIRQLPQNSGIDFIYDDKEKRHNSDVALMLGDRPELRKQETLTTVKNIYLLADCDYILSCRGSWFYNSLAMSYFRNKKLNGILLQQRDETECDVKFLVR